MSVKDLLLMRCDARVVVRICIMVLMVAMSLAALSYTVGYFILVREPVFLGLSGGPRAEYEVYWGETVFGPLHWVDKHWLRPKTWHPLQYRHKYAGAGVEPGDVMDVIEKRGASAVCTVTYLGSTRGAILGPVHEPDRWHGFGDAVKGFTLIDAYEQSWRTARTDGSGSSSVTRVTLLCPDARRTIVLPEIGEWTIDSRSGRILKDAAPTASVPITLWFGGFAEKYWFLVDGRVYGLVRLSEEKTRTVRTVSGRELALGGEWLHISQGKGVVHVELDNKHVTLTSGVTYIHDPNRWAGRGEEYAPKVLWTGAVARTAARLHGDPKGQTAE
jgi:hypothetical protein